MNPARSFPSLGLLGLLVWLTGLPAPLQAEHRRGSRLYAVSVPFPPTLAKAQYAQEVTEALNRLQRTLPEVSVLYLGFDAHQSTIADWIAILNLCHQTGFKVVVGFAEFQDESRTYEHYRPSFSHRQWQWGPYRAFVSDQACITHPALYAVFTVDEPWHHRKRPVYSTDDLKAMYADLKHLAPPGTDFNILVQFSRELWKRLVRARPNPKVYWDRGLCDIVQISALEFQDEAYQEELLDQNHSWSRKLIHEKTPEIPLWTSVQVMGSRYGPPGNYWFPRERGQVHDLTRLLNDLTDARYESIHPLSGLMFQCWDSTTLERRPGQYTLGDQDKVGTGVSQREAAQDAITAIRKWTQRD